MEKLEREVCAIVADALEIESISPEDDYRAYPLWGSLTAFMMKLAIARRYSREFTIKRLGEFASVRELAGALAI